MDKPILFSTPMVQAILRGSKTQTRRIIKTYPHDHQFTKCINENETWVFKSADDVLFWIYGKSPYQVGDRLWVRETFKYLDISFRETNTRVKVQYKVDGNESWVNPLTETQITLPDKWRPSIFMPRWASRITLEVTEVRVQRVQEISEGDCLAEGFQIHYIDHPFYGSIGSNPKTEYHILWDKLNSKRGYSWGSNPFVWCISFKVEK